MKIAFFDWPHWAIGKMNSEIIKRLPEQGSILLNWSESYTLEYMSGLLSEDYMFCTSGPGLHALVSSYKIPLDRIYIVSHDEDDFNCIKKAFGIELIPTLNNLKGFAVPAPQTMQSLLGHGIQRIPQRIRYGIDVNSWTFKPRNKIDSIGVCGAIARVSNTGHSDCKRASLIKEVANALKIPFVNTGCAVSDVNEWYQTVDLNMVAGIFEGGPLSPFEAAACGIPTIGTFTGSWIDLPYSGVGIFVSAGNTKYVKEAIQAITYFKDNLSAYEEMSYKARHEIARFDWPVVICDWIDFFQNPTNDRLL